jgi:cystathionine beta-synthase
MTQTQRQHGAPLEMFDDDPPVTSIMAGFVIGVTPKTDLTAALRLMNSMNIRQLPVIEAGGRYVGVIEEADLTRCLAQGLGRPYSSWLHVGQLVHRVVPVPSTARRSDVARQMCADQTDVVLVADGNSPRGIVTVSDVLRSLARPDNPDPQ